MNGPTTALFQTVCYMLSGLILTGIYHAFGGAIMMLFVFGLFMFHLFYRLKTGRDFDWDEVDRM